MFNHSKLVPALVVLASLAPFAAQAWTGDVSGGHAASQVQSFPVGQPANANQGRANQDHPSGYSMLTPDDQYAGTGAQGNAHS